MEQLLLSLSPGANLVDLVKFSPARKREKIDEVSSTLVRVLLENSRVEYRDSSKNQRLL